MKTLTIISYLFLLVVFNTAALAQEPLKKNDRIVFLGDSITAAGVRKTGYITLSSAAIAKAHPDLNIEVIGAGIGGHKVPDCQKRLDKDVLQKKPTIVFIYIGINDVWHWTHPRVIARGKKGTTPKEFENGLKDMVAKINKAGARVILCTPTVIGEKSDGSNSDDKRLDQYSNISRKVAKETGSQLLDLKNNGAHVTRANLLYTDNGGHRYEEWYRTPATPKSDGTVTATLPKGTTHYLINLIDEHNFLVSFPGGFKKDGRDKQYSEYALKARPPKK